MRAPAETLVDGERARITAELAADARFRRAFFDAPIGMALAGLDGRVRQANRALCELLAASPEHLQTTTLQELTHPDDVREDLRQRARLLEGLAGSYRLEKRCLRTDGEAVWVLFSAALVSDAPGRSSSLVCHFQDITERKQAEDRLGWLALHDTLTRLPNRALFVDRLRQALARAERRSSSVALLFLDLDRFKLVNDSFGHHAGDRLLRGVAERLASVVRPGDTVARLGGDEFTVLCEDLADADEVLVVAERVVRALSRPFFLGDSQVETSASVGIAFTSGPGTDTPESLLHGADAAMYRAKERGRSRYEVLLRRPPA